jgi:hypothetical protein
MLGTQIQTLGQLGTTGRGIQQRGLDAQYTAATQMADEPFMRLQRGLQVLGQGAQFLPQFGTGFGTGQQAIGAYQQPGTLGRLAGAAGNVASIFQAGQQIFGKPDDQK